MKRTGKFYRKNEKEIMEDLGLKATKGSGCGWIEKEDGQNENIICQLKSTDAKSIKINKLDIDKLIYNASVSNKVPLFAVQFLETNEVFLLLKPEDLDLVYKYLILKEKDKNIFDLPEQIISEATENEGKRIKAIKSSLKARLKVNKENENKFKKERKQAK